PYLRHRGIRAIDVLAASHDDDDHKGGAASVLGLLPVRSLVTGPGVPAGAFGPGAPPRTHCRRGQRWDWDGVGFEWQHPGPERHERDNDGSCVLAVRAGGRSVLIAGDIEAGAEAQWVAAHPGGSVDVVVAPHHGSRTSSTAPFVATTRPAWVVYAVGHRNRWNFPVRSVTERWQAVGARSLATSSSGAVTFELGPDAGLVPGEWRRETPRPWRDP
ncbi:MAG: ComEC/Rec2 family competence protein, partial [Steroidobacteraceae bacterium]